MRIMLPQVEEAQRVVETIDAMPSAVKDHVTDTIVEQVLSFPVGAMAMCMVLGLIFATGISYAIAELSVKLAHKPAVRAIIGAASAAIPCALLGATLLAGWYWLGVSGFAGGVLSIFIVPLLRKKLGLPSLPAETQPAMVAVTPDQLKAMQVSTSNFTTTGLLRLKEAIDGHEGDMINKSDLHEIVDQTCADCPKKVK